MIAAAIIIWLAGAASTVKAVFSWREDDTGGAVLFWFISLLCFCTSIICIIGDEKLPASEIRCTTIEGAAYSESNDACYKDGVKINFNEDGADE